MHRVVQQEHVKVTIHIIIKEKSLRTEAREVKSILFGLIFIKRHAVFIDPLANKKLILAVENLVLTNPAYVNIKQAIVVEVNNRNAGRPAAILRNMRFVGYICKTHFTLV